MEDDCHQLDLQLTTTSSTNPSCSVTNFQRYHEAKAQLNTLNNEKAQLASENDQANQVLVLLLLTTTDPESDIRVKQVAELINNNSKRIMDTVSDMCNL